ncbi:MAG: hypothetical protein WD696_14905 [Bryobacteraceae bacterium]
MCDRTAAPTPESYTWDFSGEASRLLEDLEFRARNVAFHSDRLVSYARRPLDLSYETQASELTQAKEHINAMGEILCRLQRIAYVTDPWQREAIYDVLPAAQTLARSTEEAIELLNEKRSSGYMPLYEESVADMYAEGKRIAETVDASVALADARERMSELREEAGA